MKIDAHHHLWHYDPAQYAWIDESMKTLRRDFMPEHLLKETQAAGIEGVITVQARQTPGETEWLLNLAATNPLIKGVVGWVDLRSPLIGAELERLKGNPKLKAVRHVVQGEPDDFFILGKDFNRGIRELKAHGLAYDLLVFERHLPQTIQFVDTHPGQVFILDHLAKPRVKDGQLAPWAKNLQELAKRPNVFCKASGLVTEADHGAWTEAQLRPYFEIALETFGPKRLMFGSDWPVCLVACGYARWHALVSSWLSRLSLYEQAAVLGGTAIKAYHL